MSKNYWAGLTDLLARPRSGWVHWIDEAKPTCPVQYRVKSLSELDASELSLQGQEWIGKWGGRTATNAKPWKDMGSTAELLVLEIDGKWIEFQTDWVETSAVHTWHDNGGLLRTWCICCDADGEWDRTQFKYVERLYGKTVLSQSQEKPA